MATFNSVFEIVSVHPLIQVPNQLVGAPLEKTVILQCISEAYPKPINYWEKEEKSGSTNTKYIQ